MKIIQISNYYSNPLLYFLLKNFPIKFQMSILKVLEKIISLQYTFIETEGRMDRQKEVLFDLDRKLQVG